MFVTKFLPVDFEVTLYNSVAFGILYFETTLTVHCPLIVPSQFFLNIWPQMSEAPCSTREVMLNRNRLERA